MIYFTWKLYLFWLLLLHLPFFCCFMIHKVFENIEDEHRMIVTEMTGDGFWLMQAKSLFAVQSWQNPFKNYDLHSLAYQNFCLLDYLSYHGGYTLLCLLGKLLQPVDMNIFFTHMYPLTNYILNSNLNWI